MAIGDDLLSMLGIGGAGASPFSQVLQGLQAPTPPPVGADATAAAASGGGTTPPAAPTATPPPAAAGGAPSGQLPPNAQSTPPDINAIYQKILDKDRSMRMIDSGATLLAAAYSSPSMKNILAQQSGAISAGGYGAPGDTLKTMLALQQMQEANKQKQATLNQIPALAAKLKMDPQALLTLYQTDPGKYAEAVAKTQAPDKDPEAIQKVKYAHDNWQILNMPDPSSTDPKDVAFWRDYDMRTLGGGGGVNITMPSQTQETAEARKVGEGIGGSRADYIKGYAPAQQKLDNLTTIEDAINKGGDNVYTGPFAKQILQGKELLSGITGKPVSGTAETEVAQKAGFALATAAVKAISSRPTQMEFVKGLENVPGLALSREGNLAMINILKQQANAEKQLAEDATKPEFAGANWLPHVTNFYREHPIVSPFDNNPDPSKRAPFSQADIDRIKSGATGNLEHTEDVPNTPKFDTPGAGSIDYLKKNPTAQNKKFFDEKFGPGAAAKVFGQ